MAQFRIDTLLIFGKYDRVIPPVIGEQFADGSFPAGCWYSIKAIS